MRYLRLSVMLTRTRVPARRVMYLWTDLRSRKTNYNDSHQSLNEVGGKNDFIVWMCWSLRGPINFITWSSRGPINFIKVNVVNET